MATILFPSMPSGMGRHSVRLLVFRQREQQMRFHRWHLLILRA